MEKRSQLVLDAVIREHIKTAQPVGSEVLVNKYKLGVSSATVRSEMSDLEEAGFIVQPHKSAGRVPTSKAYSFWVSRLTEKSVNDKEQGVINDLFLNLDEQGLKRLAKEFAQISGLAVFLAIHKNNLYYTGVSNLLTQPEFVQGNLIYDISPVIDRIEEVIESNFSNFDFNLNILIGENNPFSQLCSSLVLKYRLAGQVGLLGIIGPMRMDYQRNIALLRLFEKKLKD